VEWIDLAEVIDKRQAVVNALMSVRVPRRRGIY